MLRRRTQDVPSRGSFARELGSAVVKDGFRALHGWNMAGARMQTPAHIFSIKEV